MLWLVGAASSLASSPPPLLFGSVIGGGQTDRINAVATDAAGNIYLAGETYSADFSAGGGSKTARPSLDAFVVKISAAGAPILYATFLGGSGAESARGVAVDNQGSVYVTGVTTSADFPSTRGAFQAVSRSPGIEKAFVAKLSSTGAIVWATYLGGSSIDIGYGIAIDSGGSAYVTGSTASPNFPATVGAPQQSLAGASDCFIAKLNAAGSDLLFSTYLGGEGIDLCKAIAVDPYGGAFVTGGTTSLHFPLAGALKQALTGGADAFLTRISPAGDHFVFSTYIGGDAVDNGNAVQVDSSGAVYIGGDTTSTSLPVTPLAPQKTLAGDYDGFVFTLANDGSKILFGTYLGGSGPDSVTALAVAQNGSIGLTGYTASTNFPTAGAVQASLAGSFDAFAAVIPASRTSFALATYIGGGGDDRGLGIALLAPNAFLVAGQTLPGSVPYLQGGLSSSNSGQMDGFFAALTVPAPGLRFVPVTPCRVADTRNANGPFGGPAIMGTTRRDFYIPNSACGIPATAEAYSLNITVVPSGMLGFLTIWPSGQPQPGVSALNSLDGRIKAGAAIVPAGDNGGVSVYVTDTAHALLDINGYFVPASDSSALAFYPIPPCRVADTRNTTGTLGGPSLAAAKTRTFPILSGVCGIPVTAQAYSLSFTAVPRGYLGFVSTWPTGRTRPPVSTLNALTGVVTANAAIVPAGLDGSIDTIATNDSDLLIDISGYFGPPGPGGLSLYNLAPCRVFDSRILPGAPPISGSNDIQISAGRCNIPPAAQAFVLNATVVPSGYLGFLTLWPQGQTRPNISILNALDGAITSNMAIIPTTNGAVTAFLTNGSHLLLDASGYFAL